MEITPINGDPITERMNFSLFGPKLVMATLTQPSGGLLAACDTDEIVVRFRRGEYGSVDFVGEDGSSVRYQILANDSFSMSAELVVFADELALRDPSSSWGSIDREVTHVHP